MKPTHKTKLNIEGKSISIDTPYFGSRGHVDYSGYGSHGLRGKDKARSDRRNNRKESKQVQRGDW